MADQVAVLRHGVIAQLDTPAGIYQRPLDPALARFLGESNVLHATVSAGGPNGTAAMVADTPLGSLPVEGWPVPRGRPGSRMIRPEQLVIGDVDLGRLAGTVESYEYYGHDAVARVQPEAGSLPDLIVRVTGGIPLVTGARVGLTRGRGRWWPGPRGARTQQEEGPTAGDRHRQEAPRSRKHASVTAAVSSRVHYS